MGLVRRATKRYADEQAWARRWVGGKLERDAAAHNRAGEIVWPLARDAGGPFVLSFIYGQVEA